MIEEQVEKDMHFVVAIGASAGGLEAIHAFFDHMPESSNVSFVIIQHLSPDHKSLLVDLVSRHTHMKVYEAEDNLQVRKNCIYVIPNNKLITLQGNRLILSEKQSKSNPNNAIDVFMYTLARERKGEAIAVVLSGTGTDGTKGIAKIKEEGGMVIVQDPASAKFDGMPNSAIAGGNIDYVLRPEEIPVQIANYVAGAKNISEESLTDEMLERIFESIHRQAGLDFFFYKTPTIARRVIHRIRKGKFGSVNDYLKFLESDPDENRLLGKDFLINVTRFFRDEEAYSTLRTQILPEILKGKQRDEHVKMWVCACSTGEEAYSLAILADEALGELGLENIVVKIFATDIEKSNIEYASRGVYPKSIEADVGVERLKKYFTFNGKGYTINARIRKQIVFAVHNVIKDPPFIKNDLVSCRNMLIYMNSSLQERIYSVLLFSLSLNGFLFLGSTESPQSIKTHLHEVGRSKIFKKVTEGRGHPYLPDMSRRPDTERRQKAGALENNVKRGLWNDFKEIAYSDFGLTAFHIDRNFEIVEAVGNFDRILSLPRQNLRLNLLRMLPGNISTAIAAEIRNAWKLEKKRVLKNLQVTSDRGTFSLTVIIKPDNPAMGKSFTVVAIQFVEEHEDQIEPLPRRTLSADVNDYVLALEEELSEVKGQLQLMVEDLETTNEEMQSTNEELLSSNEELQSSNEELQSLNEELHTLNTEHQMKIRELIELNDDLNNYFRSSNIGQVFLDKDMAIRKFTPASAHLINVIESDIGRPISHISTNVKYDGLVRDIETVFRTKETIEKEVELHSGMNILLRIMPYVTGEQMKSGVIITFFDISTVTNLNNIIRGVFNSTQSSIFALQSKRDRTNHIEDFVVLTANHAAHVLIGKYIDNIKESLVVKNRQIPVLQSMFDQFVKVVENDVPMRIDFFYEPDGIWLEASAVKMMDGLVVTLTDITQKKKSEERLRKNYGELIIAREHLRNLNIELEAKVAERTKLLAVSEERFRLVARATNDAIWDWDLVNNVVWFSDAFYLRFGYSPSEVFSREKWLEMVHDDDREHVAANIFEMVNSGEKQWVREYRFRRADGDYADILDRGSVIADDFGTPYRMLGSMMDLTDLKRAQHEAEQNVAQRKFLAQSMPLIVWTADATGKVDFANDQFQLYTGIDPDDALGDGWLKAVHPDDHERIRNLWKEAVAYRSNFQTEVRLLVVDSGYHWNILRAKVLNSHGESLTNWVITTIDIHDQKLYHELLEQKVDERTKELLRINEALEVSNNDLQQFASVASHDLQEPLRKIHLYAHLIHDRYSEILDGASPYLQKILLSSMRMKSIIDNILNYSKLSADNVGFEKTDLNKIINEILEDLEIGINEKGAQIEVGEFPLIETIPGQIRHVFQNMIGNSIKFSRPDVPPVIQIRGSRVNAREFSAVDDPQGGFLKISIQDNGIGFDRKFAQHVFVLFKRLHSKDAFEGTGIGLAIAKKIIEKHNGIIEATGKEGEGATFVIILPLQQ